MRALLESGANPNQSMVSHRGEPELMLHALSQFGVVPGIRLMLEFGADPNLLQDSDTALDIQSFEQRFTEVCQLPDEYKGRVLPEYPLPITDECDEHKGPVYQRWLMPQHQRAHGVLRKAGALHAWELKSLSMKRYAYTPTPQAACSHKEEGRMPHSMRALAAHCVYGLPNGRRATSILTWLDMTRPRFDGSTTPPPCGKHKPSGKHWRRSLLTT